MAVHSSIASFNRRLTKWAKNKPKDEILRLQRVIALEALKRVVLRTPVDTGRARGGWQVSLGRLDGADPESLDKNGGGTIEKGSSEIGKLRKFDVLYLQNNVRYIVYLERGRSKQAPEGMLAVTVLELTQIKFDTD